MTTQTTPDAAGYASTADRLVERIKALIPNHPEILELNDAWGLFKVDGFKCDDIGPSAFQASWALAKAKELYNEAKEEELVCGAYSENLFNILHNGKSDD